MPASADAKQPRYLLDSNIADRLADDPELPALEAAARGAEIVITPLQGAELSRIPPGKRRREKMEALRALASRVAPAAGGAGKQGPDRALLDVAAREDAVLVTEDAALRERSAAAGITALSYGAFRAELLAGGASQEAGGGRGGA